MIQAQDVLGLGAEARMNMPGRAAGNWHWRMAPGALTPALAARLRRATEQARRGERQPGRERGGPPAAGAQLFSIVTSVPIGV
jgi:hypothetical protein